MLSANRNLCMCWSSYRCKLVFFAKLTATTPTSYDQREEAEDERELESTVPGICPLFSPKRNVNWGILLGFGEHRRLYALSHSILAWIEICLVSSAPDSFAGVG